MLNEISIDTRELPSPEPMKKILDSLGSVNSTTYIKMIHRIKPNPLFNILKNNGFEYIVNIKNEDFIEIYIFNNQKIKTHIKENI